MPWPVMFRGERPEKPQVGDAYLVRADYVHERADGATMALGHAMSRQYDEKFVGVRRPIAVVLPDGFHCLIDAAYWGGPWGANPERVGWDVQIAKAPIAGEPLRLTLSPSVNIVGSYHGWIRDGEISEDVEGRRFPCAA